MQSRGDLGKNTQSAMLTTEDLLSDQPETLQLATAPYDPRFPNTNQSKNCWQNYVDYHKCRRAKGEDYGPCEQFRRTYKILCPSFWVINNYKVLLGYQMVCRWRIGIRLWRRAVVRSSSTHPLRPTRKNKLILLFILSLKFQFKLFLLLQLRRTSHQLLIQKDDLI